MSRYQSSYDSGESRRSPRDQSPGRYNDARDDYRSGSGRGGERRRSIPDARGNHNAFASNRDIFREPVGRDLSRDFPPREPPRGPKGLIDAPTGPRATNYSSDFRPDFSFRGDFRGDRGRGGRGRGWRDDSRDRGREGDRGDYRDRRDDRPLQFRDDRGRERWGPRENYRGGRRPSSPQGRGRSPNYGPRDARDAPPNLDIDRSRRESRDGPLSGGSPASESVQQFRGYGRGRGGRSRGRGGYYGEDFRPPGRSRSPEAGWNRRTQPAATPPPQVPAFGSTSTNLLVGLKLPTSPAAMMTDSNSGPIPGVAVPTAPRSLVGDRGIARARQGIGSAKWTNPQIKASNYSHDSPPMRTVTPPKNSAYNMEAAVSPQSKDCPLENEESEAQNTVEQTEATSKSDTEILHQPPASQRLPIIGKRPPKAPALAISTIGDESASDSGDDVDEHWFENQISVIKEQISKISAENPLVPRAEIRAVFLRPWIESTIDDLVKACGSACPIGHKICPALGIREVKEEPVLEPPAIPLNLASEPIAGRSKSRSPPPRPDTEFAEQPMVNGTDTVIKAMATASAEVNESREHQQDSAPIETPVLAPVSYDSPDADHEEDDIEVPVEPDANHQPMPVVNGEGRDSVAMRDTFEDSDDEETRAENIEALEVVRKYMKTPPISSLPNFNTKPWHQDEAFFRTLAPKPEVEARIKRNLQETTARRLREQEEERYRWQERYLRYRRWTDFDDDPVAVKSRIQFQKSRAEAAAAAAAPPLSSIPAAGTKPEGGRRMGSRFATEHDIERVLRESEQEAKEKKEVEERAARAKTASAKEATIPDMAWDQEEWDAKKFVDRSHIVPFERSLARLEFSEPIDNFTEEECQSFETAYMEFPKQWGKIADALPGRDYKACIQHYYLVKHPSNLKEKLKKQPKKRKGKGRKGANAKTNGLMAEIGLTIRDEGEDGADAENGERRRPRRAAAPTWPFEAPASESEVASPAPTPGRKAAALSKADLNTETPAPKRRAKVPREKGAKQAKNSQLLAAAPIAANRQIESPATPVAPTEWKNRRETAGPGPSPGAPALGPSPGPSRFPPQCDGAGSSQPSFSPSIPIERPSPSMNVNFEVMNQSFATQERLGSAPPMNNDAQQDRRNAQQTSSYWSVSEQNEFTLLLRHFGTDWHGIAKLMTSKTHIMVYTTVFQQWLAVPSDSNKSRRVANIQTQVKNYYQRQVEAGKKEWEEIAKEADEKRARGEPVGPLPTPTILPKRRYDFTPSSTGRPGSAIDGNEDMTSIGSNSIIPQVASQQPSLVSTRFPALAQAGPVPQLQPATPALVLNKHLPPQPIQQPMQQPIQQPTQQPMQHPLQQSVQQAPQQPVQKSIQQAPSQSQQQPRQPRGSGPVLGYFPAEPPSRTAIQADVVSQHSLMVAQAAQIEKTNALRQQAIQREQQQAAMQREQQQAMQLEQAMQREQAQREQALALQKDRDREREQQHQQQQVLQRGRHFQMKQENEKPNLRQYEPYNSPSVHSGSIPQSRPEAVRPAIPTAPEVRRTVQPQPYQPRNPGRNLLGENGPGHREIKSSLSPAIGRPPMSAPPTSLEPYAPPPPLPAPVTAVRQPEVRKTSSIMSLLNDEPSEPRPTPTKRVSDVSASSLQPSRTPPPPQHSLQSRYAAHPPASQTPQQIQQPIPPPQQPPQQQVSQSQHSYAQPTSHPLPQHSSSIGHSRSYTSTSFESRGYASSQMQQQQHMYSHQSRPSMPTQPQPIRRESSLGDVHGITNGYGRTSVLPQPRLNESPYSATPPPQAPQSVRPSAGSPLDMQPSQRDYYQRNSQPQYIIQQQTSAAGSPQLGPTYHPQSQQQPQPSHRQLAFGQSQSHLASPPGQHISQHPLRGSRQNSFDGRSQIATTSAPTPVQQGYIQAPAYQNPPLSVYPQQPHPSQFHDEYYTR